MLKLNYRSWLTTAPLLGTVVACGGNVAVDTVTSAGGYTSTGAPSTYTTTEGTSVATTTATSGSSGSVSTSSSACPAAAPAVGSTCALPNDAGCEFGKKACCACCGTTYVCTNGTWTVVPMPPCVSVDPPACPTSVPDAGDTCEPCDYPSWGCGYCGIETPVLAACGDAGTWELAPTTCSGIK
jgi:hypothetical protein